MVHLEPFDPSREFVTNRWFRWSGMYLGPNVAFPPEGHDAEPYNLQTLYNARYIRYGSAAPIAPALVKARGAGPTAPIVTAAATVIPPPPLPPLPPLPKGSENKIAQLVADNTHAALLALAADLPDVKRTQTKTEIATAIVRAGDGIS